MEIKKLDPLDIDLFIELIKVFKEAFEMDDFLVSSKKYLQKVLLEKNLLVFIALVNNKVVGGCTVYVLTQYYSEKPLAYLYDLAVKKSYQRQGIGKELIIFLTQYCKEKKFQELYVQADKEDGHALEFYRSTRITKEEQVVHFSYNLTDSCFLPCAV